jgi:hypothetical protein
MEQLTTLQEETHNANDEDQTDARAENSRTCHRQISPV